MLSLLRHNLPGTPAVLADLRALALEGTFAGVLAWNSFFHLSPADQRTMFTRFRAHAASGAAPMFTSGPAEGSAVGERVGEPPYHGSLDPDEYRALLDSAGLRVIGHVAEAPSCGFRTVWLTSRYDREVPLPLRLTRSQLNERQVSGSDEAPLDGRSGSPPPGDACRGEQLRT